MARKRINKTNKTKRVKKTHNTRKTQRLRRKTRRRRNKKGGIISIKKKWNEFKSNHPNSYRLLSRFKSLKKQRKKDNSIINPLLPEQKKEEAEAKAKEALAKAVAKERKEKEIAAAKAAEAKKEEEKKEITEKLDKGEDLEEVIRKKATQNGETMKQNVIKQHMRKNICEDRPGYSGCRTEYEINTTRNPNFYLRFEERYIDAEYKRLMELMERIPTN
jgi:hypothetical protein